MCVATADNRAFEVDEVEYQCMYNIGAHLTAKISWHDYAESYSQYFGKVKNKPLKILEIGILNGGSLKLWEEYFQNAEIYGIDTTLDYISVDLKRSICYIADQSKPADLMRVVRDSGGGFDIIIDDGEHLPQGQITSFVTLFPHLNRGGIYVIEDLHAAYWTDYGGVGSKENPNADGYTMVTFLKHLIDDVNFVGAALGRCNHRLLACDYSIETIQDRLDLFKRDILSIHFYDGVCFVLKR